MNHIKTKSYNFLLEMLIVIIIFTLCSIIFLQLFVTSSKKSNRAVMLSNANNDVISIASYIKQGLDYNINYSGDGYYISVSENDDKQYNIKAIDNNEEILIDINVAVTGGNYEEK